MSTDGGATWQDVTPTVTGGDQLQAPGTLVYVTGSVGRPEDGGVYMTSAQGLWFLPLEGTEWQLLSARASDLPTGGTESYYTTALFVDTTYTEDYDKAGPVIYEAREAFGDQGAVYLGVFRSIDGGKTWEKFGTGLENHSVRALLLAPHDPVAQPGMVETLIAATDDGIWTASMPPNR
jgi:hypothetical protein